MAESFNLTERFHNIMRFNEAHETCFSNIDRAVEDIRTERIAKYLLHGTITPTITSDDDLIEILGLVSAEYLLDDLQMHEVIEISKKTLEEEYGEA
jgi:hypothetical protein